ncbi:TetR/AcrR family transcriptional regulator [Pannonibacter phragmitetus]|uniref:TetR/AcrR family transcriptional regulator n=1 Tax=Pannonibacter phragmitetus TaxID=121719 RepID=UPI001AD89F88|nr:TetR/AcrR family transcriptional regulator [Pannonibacter phragmitetus]
MNVTEVQQGSRQTKREATRERLIDAAVELVYAESARKLSLEAVAERAGVSKGGLLYHFKSKSELLRAMVERHMAMVSKSVSEAFEETLRDNKPNALMRAYLIAVARDVCPLSEPPAGMLAAIAEEPELLAPVKAHHVSLVREIRATCETPELAEIAFLAIEGVWQLMMFSVCPFSEGEILQRLDRLSELLANPPAAFTAIDGESPRHS